MVEVCFSLPWYDESMMHTVSAEPKDIYESCNWYRTTHNDLEELPECKAHAAR